MAITKSLIKRMRDPNSVKPEQHKHRAPRPESVVVPTVLENLDLALDKIESEAEVEEVVRIETESIRHIDDKLEEILDALQSLSDKYEGVKSNMELILSDIQGLNIQVSELTAKKPSLIMRLIKWQR
jgi:vacuolar-type H+-ATPase subunit I/STV1